MSDDSAGLGLEMGGGLVPQVVGLDVGDRRIGVAISDPLGYTVQPLFYAPPEGPARGPEGGAEVDWAGCCGLHGVTGGGGGESAAYVGRCESAGGEVAGVCGGRCGRKVWGDGASVGRAADVDGGARDSGRTRAMLPRGPERRRVIDQSGGGGDFAVVSCRRGRRCRSGGGHLASALTTLAQNTPLRGRVSDETGAVIPGAAITATSATGKTFSAKSSSDGSYSLTAIPPGTYVVEAKFVGFFMKQPVTFVARGQAINLNLVLTVNPVVQQLTVKADESGGVSVDSSNNAGAVVLRGSDLDSLADNPDDLASDLQALAGPSAGPSGASFYIDGFSTGEMPPKDSIREIRINQNPFSPEFDKLGLGRIEIFTKPGSDKFHGSAFFNIGSSALNSRNPYASIKAPFLLREFGTSLVGPLNKHATFTLDARGDATDNGAVINGAIVDPVSLAIIDPYSNVFNVAQHRVLVTSKVVITASLARTTQPPFVIVSLRSRTFQTPGLGNLQLLLKVPHHTFHSLAQTVQFFVETAVLGANAVNIETRFQFFNVSSSNIAVNQGASIQVLNAFTGGGSPIVNSSDVTRNWELQYITTLTRGVHVSLRAPGCQLRPTRNVSRLNFNGTFIFGDK